MLLTFCYDGLIVLICSIRSIPAKKQKQVYTIDIVNDMDTENDFADFN